MNKSWRFGWAVAFAVACPMLVHAQELSVVPRGGVGNEITINPGDTVTLDVYVQNVSPTLLRLYNVALPVQADGGLFGTLQHDGNSPVLDQSHPDYVFAGLSSFSAPGLGPPPQISNVLESPGDAVLVTAPKYCGDFTFVASLDAVGVFVVDMANPLDDTFLVDPTDAIIPFTSIPALITVRCLEDADCDDELFCNGMESCSNDMCFAGNNPCTDPGLPLCDEDQDLCGECLGDEDCDDGEVCNGMETCVLGLCQAGADLPMGTMCGDQTENDCTDPDTCDGAGNCQDNHAPNGQDCNDTLFCNIGETCTDGVCGGGGPNPCDDGLPCTNDSCDEGDNRCDNILQAGFCLIDDTCVPDGAENPANECEVCDTAVTTMAYSPKADGTDCADDSNDCTDDICQSGACTHPDEPMGTECDDGDPCTEDECDGMGNCIGTPVPDCADDCVNAIEAFEGANETTNVGFDVDDAEAGCQPNSNFDAWFVYTATCDGVVRVDTEGSSFAPFNDTVLSVFDSCGGTEIACDDDGGTGLLSTTTFSAVAGEDYFIRVAGFNQNAGTIVLNIARTDTCRVDPDPTCYVLGEVNPGNECEVCIPLLSATDWSPRPAGTACGDPGFGECDSPDACDGAGTCEDNNKPDGVFCTPDANDCTQDICVAGVCAHPNEPVDTPCGDTVTDTDCDKPDSCDGMGMCLDNFEPVDTLCGDTETDTDCDNPDTCDGAGMCLDNLEMDGIDCTDDMNDCTDDVCEAGLCVHPNLAEGTMCGDQSTSDCDNPDTCDGDGICLANHEMNGTACNDDNGCTGSDACVDGVCTGIFVPDTPVVAAAGPKVIHVTPQPGASTVPQALRVTSPDDHPCVVKYVDVDGTLVDTPVFQPASTWNLVQVRGLEIVPDSTYHIEAECGGDLTPPAIVTTNVWADVNGDGFVSALDILCILEEIQANPICPLGGGDLFPCAPDGFLNALDILQVLETIQNTPYPCMLPCAPSSSSAGPIVEVADADPVRFAIQPRARAMSAGGTVAVDVYVRRGAAGLRAFEVGIEAVAASGDPLEMVDAYVQADRRDYVFYGMDAATAGDIVAGRALGVLLGGGGGGIAAGPSYLATFVFQAPHGARGVVEVRLRDAGATILLDSTGRIMQHESLSATPIVIGR